MRQWATAACQASSGVAAAGMSKGLIRASAGTEAPAAEAAWWRWPPRREAAALEVGEGGLVRGDHAGAGTGFDAHVADGHAAFHRERADGGAGVLDDVAGGSVGADAADDVEDDVLGGDAEGKLAFDVDAEGFGLVLREGSGWP